MSEQDLTHDELVRLACVRVISESSPLRLRSDEYTYEEHARQVVEAADVLAVYVRDGR